MFFFVNDSGVVKKRRTDWEGGLMMIRGVNDFVGWGVFNDFNDCVNVFLKKMDILRWGKGLMMIGGGMT